MISPEALKILEDSRTLKFGGSYQGEAVILAEILVLLRKAVNAQPKKTPKEKVAV
jgi:hypothetical protein